MPYELLDEAPAGRFEMLEGKANNPDYQAGRRASDLKRWAATIANGPLMGFADEIGGAIGGAYDTLTQPSQTLSGLVTGKQPKTFAENYQANRDAIRGMEAQTKEDYPLTSAGLQIGASLPLGFVRLGLGGANVVRQSVAPVMGTVEKLARTAGIGAGYGAVGGLGNSEADTLGGMAADTALGGGTGAVLSPVVGGAANILGAGASNVKQRFSQAAANQAAQEKVAQALSRDARGSVFTSGQANPLTQALARYDKLGDPAVLADAGGVSTNKLLDQMVTLPGRSAETTAQLLRQRQAGVGNRMRADADSALGTQGQRLTDTVESLISQREQAAGPLYAQLHRVNVPATPKLTGILQAADDLGATKLGQEIATARELPWTLTLNKPGQDWTYYRYDMRDLDHVKQGLDQLLTSRKALNADGTLTPLGNSYQGLKNRLLAELDQATTNPQTGESLYRSARNAFAGPSALIDAASAGRRAVNMDEAGIQQAVRALSGSEQEAFRIGAYEGLRQKLGTQGGQTNIMAMWKNPSTQEQLRAIFGDERSFRDFAANTAKEAALKRLQSVGQGSQTASRLAGMADLDNPALSGAAGALASAKTGNPIGVLAGANKLYSAVAMPETTRNQIGQLLLSGGQQGRNNLVNMGDLIARINQQSALLNQTTGQMGSQIGNQLAPRLFLPPN
jgi:hypothetical protein